MSLLKHVCYKIFKILKLVTLFSEHYLYLRTFVYFYRIVFENPCIYALNFLIYIQYFFINSIHTYICQYILIYLLPLISNRRQHSVYMQIFSKILFSCIHTHKYNMHTFFIYHIYKKYNHIITFIYRNINIFENKILNHLRINFSCFVPNLSYILF